MRHVPAFLFALNTAQAYIQSGQIKNALVVGADCMSDLLDWEDRGRASFLGMVRELWY